MSLFKNQAKNIIPYISMVVN